MIQVTKRNGTKEDLNIEKLHIRLLDEQGVVINLNNVDFTLTFELEVLNVHYSMLDQ